MNSQTKKRALDTSVLPAGSVLLDGDTWTRAFSWQPDSDWINDRTDARINYKVMLKRDWTTPNSKNERPRVAQKETTDEN